MASAMCSRLVGSMRVHLCPPDPYPSQYPHPPSTGVINGPAPRGSVCTRQTNSINAVMATFPLGNGANRTLRRPYGCPQLCPHVWSTCGLPGVMTRRNSRDLDTRLSWETRAPRRAHSVRERLAVAAHRVFEQRTIPAGEIRRGVVSAFEKRQERGGRIR